MQNTSWAIKQQEFQNSIVPNCIAKGKKDTEIYEPNVTVSFSKVISVHHRFLCRSFFLFEHSYLFSFV